MDVTEAKYVSGHNVYLKFSDGTEGVADLTEDFMKFGITTDNLNVVNCRVEGGTLWWPTGFDIAVERLYALVHTGLKAPETFEDAQNNELEVSLRELRRFGDVRQEDLAETLEITQGAISRLETSIGNSKIATIRRYAQALGWEIEVVAVKGDKRLRIRGI